MFDTYRDMNISTYFIFQALRFDLNDNHFLFLAFDLVHRVGIEYTQGQDQNPYLAATYVKKESPKEEKKAPAPLPEASESDSDSN